MSLIQEDSNGTYCYINLKIIINKIVEITGFLFLVFYYCRVTTVIHHSGSQVNNVGL